MEKQRTEIKLSRRNLLKVTAGVVASLTLVGCGSGSSATQAPAATKASGAATAAPKTAATAAAGAAGAIKRGGTLRCALGWTMPSLDPHLTTSKYHPTYPLLFDQLMRRVLVDRAKGVFEIKPELAVSWERPTPTEFVMKLRQDVKFHDGSPFNAEVARWNINRWMTDPKFYTKQYISSFEKVEAVDANTVKITLKNPLVSLEAILGGGTDPNFAIISKEAFEKAGADAFGTHPVGSGPMKFVDWKRDDTLTLERNENYWMMAPDGKPFPYFDRYVERYIQDPAVILAEMRAGTIDLTENIEGKDIAATKSNPELEYWQIDWAGPHYFTASYSFSGGRFHDNLKLRQAANYALNREAMAKTFGFGVGTPHYYPYWGPGMLGYDESIPKYDYQPEKAKQLLAEAGFSGGVDVTLSVITRAQENRIGEMVKSMWDAVGIRTTLESMERVAWIEKINTGKYDACFWRQGPNPDPDLASRGIVSGAGANWAQAKIPEIDKLMQDGRLEQDDKKRHEIYKQVQQVMYDTAYWTVGYFMPENKVYRKNVHDVSVTFQNLDPRWIWIG